MNKFLFSVYLSCCNAFSNKKIFCIVILSYFFGLLMPFYCLANMEVFISSMGTIDVIDSENTYKADLQALYGKEGADIEHSLSSLGLADFLVTTYFRGDIQADGISAKAAVIGTGEDWAGFERFGMIEGTFPSGRRMRLRGKRSVWWRKAWLRNTICTRGAISR